MQQESELSPRCPMEYLTKGLMVERRDDAPTPADAHQALPRKKSKEKKKDKVSGDKSPGGKKSRTLSKEHEKEHKKKKEKKDKDKEDDGSVSPLKVHKKHDHDDEDQPGKKKKKERKEKRKKTPRSGHMRNIMELPDELQLHIMKFLPLQSLCCVSQVCKEWHRLTSDDHVWSMMYASKWPKAYRAEQSNIHAKTEPSSSTSSGWRGSFAHRAAIENNWRTGNCKVASIQLTDIIYCLNFNEDIIVASLRDDLVRVIDIHNGKTVKLLRGHRGYVGTCDFDSKIICSGSWDRSIKVWDIDSAKLVRSIEAAHTLEVVVLKFEQDTLVSGSADSTIKVWDLNRGACTSLLQGHTKDVCTLQFDENRCISGSKDSTIKIWDMREARCSSTLREHEDGVWAIQYEDDELISASRDSTIKVWDMRTGRSRMTLRGHTSKVLTMMFDETKIVTGSEDNSIRVWDRNTGQSFGTVPVGHKGKVWTLKFKDAVMVSGSHDTSVRITCFDKSKPRR